MLAALAVTTLVYWPGLSGGWLFDDFPNIVENPGVQPSHASIATLTQAALSSPSSTFKRPLASLSFAANYLVGGLHPFGWKLTNLIIHLLNGILLFFLTRKLLDLAPRNTESGLVNATAAKWSGTIAASITAAWLLLPINLTGVLYVVQRMESLANAFVLLGLLGYVAGRQRMMERVPIPRPDAARRAWRGFLLCVLSVAACTLVGGTAKETAAMLPLYAFLIEWIMFRFRTTDPGQTSATSSASDASKTEWKVVAFFVVSLAIPLIAGLIWLLPKVMSPEAWATRDFTLQTRLLSEMRIVVGYIAWSLLALPHWLSFYHDDYRISTGWLHPWSTLASALILLLLVISVFKLRQRRPLVALGIALFLGCHLLTATIIPLELIYEHRNYFASFGLLLAIMPLLVVPGRSWMARTRQGSALLAILTWTALTAATAYAWGNPLRLAEELAARAPHSPRAQYELGRSYIIASGYDPASPYTPMVYPPLERAARLPDSSILPQQALIFFNARMHRPIKDVWWDSLIASLKRRKPGVQDESSLAALVQCARTGLCILPEARMQAAFKAAISHPDTDARIWSYYSDYAWNVMGDHSLGLSLIQRAVSDAPDEPAYHITLARMLIANGEFEQARKQIAALERLNIGGRLEGSIRNLRGQMPAS
ncbi:hypothetical protein LF63_0111665 [Oleiagrimonas soli]|uniref:Tetratricopeptide repeat protein n=1 Tax=Oleiagrimonas soli TaxID=1543381 RepID=A0A099CTE0_9GAMM|nr:hypothetical protein LF63_0111665 [Oleiagrimonas soli]